MKRLAAPFHLSLSADGCSPSNWFTGLRWVAYDLTENDVRYLIAGRASLRQHERSLLDIEWALSKSWAFWYAFFSVYGGEREWRLGATSGPVSFHLSGPLPRQMRLPTQYERELGISWHHWYLHLYLWADPDRYDSERDWSNPSSSFRKPLVNLNPFDLIAGGFRCDVECLGTEQRTILMPEGAYPVTVKRMVRQWSYPRWKHVWPIPRRRYSIEVESKTGIPIPGKGENSWDIDDDAILSSGVYTWDVDEALREVTNDILDTRRKRGGNDWRPEEAKPYATVDEQPQTRQPMTEQPQVNQPVEKRDEEETLTFSLRLKYEIDPTTRLVRQAGEPEWIQIVDEPGSEENDASS